MLVTGVVLGYIPSPSNGTFSLGPLTLHMYGVMLLLGIAACIWLTGRRWVSWGGDWDLVFRVALWGVIAGVVGARLYHDITSWNQDPTIHAHWWGFAAVWDGGLGVWGGIPLGVLVGAWVVHRSGNSVRLMMDAVAPGLLLAQAIGRFGNYWNQELYGRPTSLPWGLRIDQAHQTGIQDKYRSAGQYGYYQPTFLYEFIWDLIGVGVLLWVDRRFTIRGPRSSRSTSPGTRPSARSRRSCGSTPPTTSCTCGSTSGSRSWSGSSRSSFFVWWQFFHEPSAKPAQKPRPVPTGPRMSRPEEPRPVTPLASGA